MYIPARSTPFKWAKGCAASARHGIWHGLIGEFVMRYLFAFLVPPVAVFMCKRTGQGVLNLIVWLISLPLILFLGLGLIGWLLCTLHAIACCRMSSIDKRVDRMVEAIGKRSAGAPEASVQQNG